MNILVVDDEDMIREGVAAFLREEGYHVILAKVNRKMSLKQKLMKQMILMHY